MSVRISREDDAEVAREIHKLAFPDDFWVGDDHVFWVARDHMDRVVGFCSAKQSFSGGVFLSRAAVIKQYAGSGLHRRMIQMRVRCAMREGARRVYTYTTLKNYESMINLLRCGFRFYDSDWQGPNVHYYELRFTK